MKKWIIVIGVIITLLGLFQSVKFLLDYDTLTQYGKGYVWGSGLLLIIGTLLIIAGLKRKKPAYNN